MVGSVREGPPGSPGAGGVGLDESTKVNDMVDTDQRCPASTATAAVVGGVDVVELVDVVAVLEEVVVTGTDVVDAAMVEVAAALDAGLGWRPDKTAVRIPGPDPALPSRPNAASTPATMTTAQTAASAFKIRRRIDTGRQS